MLESISVKNLGCFDDGNYELNLNKLNVIVGPNNSGKSIIFKFLNLLKQNICDVNWFKSSISTSSIVSDSMKKDSVSIKFQGIRFDSNDIFDHNEITYNHNSKDIRLNINHTGGLTSLILSRDVMTMSREYANDISNRNEFAKTLFENIHYIHANRATIRSDVTISGNGGYGDIAPIKSIDSTGDNVIKFLHERYSDHDPLYNDMFEWIKKIDPATSILKTPIAGNKISMDTRRGDGKNLDMNIKLSMQGNGIQNALVIISTIMFASKGSTIIIEEPETHLHPNGIEVLADLFNHAVNTLGLQIIIITHSFEIINCYCSDVGQGTPRGEDHMKIKPEDFKLVTFGNKLDESKIQEYDIKDKKYSDVRNHIKELLG